MTTTATKGTEGSDVPHLMDWLALIDALIAHDQGGEEFSGLTLEQWREQLSSPEIGYLTKSFAVGATRGIAAQWVRGLIGETGQRFIIRFDISEAA